MRQGDSGQEGGRRIAPPPSFPPPPRRPRANLGRVLARVWSEQLETDVLRVVGHRWTCTCGERGAVERSYREAEQARREHLAEQHPPPAASREGETA